MRKIFLLVSLLVMLTLACGLSVEGQQPQPQPQPQPVVTVVVVTVPVPVEPPQQPVQPVQPVQTQPPVEPVVTQAPPPPMSTEPPAQSNKVMFTANNDLSCAEGPDWQRYWFVDVLKQYEEAEVKAINGEYGLINLKGKECWVWLNKGTIEGDAGSLPFVEAPKIPIVEVQVFNNLGKYVYLVFYNWATGERVQTLALDPGMTHTVKLPSNFYSIQGYSKADKLIYQSGMIDLAVGDTNHLKGLKDPNNPPLIIIQ
jgi:hypothetical protein